MVSSLAEYVAVNVLVEAYEQRLASDNRRGAQIARRAQHGIDGFFCGRFATFEFRYFFTFSHGHLAGFGQQGFRIRALQFAAGGYGFFDVY